MLNDDGSQPWTYTRAELCYDPATKIDWNETARIALLQCYLDAKIWLASNELANAQTIFRIEANPYTAGRLQWAKHKLATIRLMRRDAINPYKTVDRYRRWLEKQGGSPCQDQSPNQPSNSAKHSENSLITTTVSGEPVTTSAELRP